MISLFLQILKILQQQLCSGPSLPWSWPQLTAVIPFCTSPLLTASGKHPNAAVRDKPPSAQCEPVQECQVSGQPRFQPCWWKQAEEGRQCQAVPCTMSCWAQSQYQNLTSNGNADDRNVQEEQTGVTACVGKGQHSLNCDLLLLLAENRVCLAQHSLKNCAVLVHHGKPSGLKKVKWVMEGNCF